MCRKQKFERLLVPWCTYTDPEIAHVGLYEEDAPGCDVYVTHFSDVDRAILDGDTRGFVKILCKRGSDKIIGATVVHERAGDLISEVSTAIEAKMGLRDLAGVIHPYPTVADAIRRCGDACNRKRLTNTAKAMLRGILEIRRGAAKIL